MVPPLEPGKRGRWPGAFVIDEQDNKSEPAAALYAGMWSCVDDYRKDPAVMAMRMKGSPVSFMLDSILIV